MVLSLFANVRSNTASRLLGGDTLHAMCKLPREDLQQKQSRLTAPVLKKHRERWRTAKAVFIDEISMVAVSSCINPIFVCSKRRSNIYILFAACVVFSLVILCSSVLLSAEAWRRDLNEMTAMKMLSLAM